MKARVLLAGFLLVGMGSVGVFGTTGDDVIFVSLRQMRSLRALVADPSSWSTLQDVVEKYTFWKISTEIESPKGTAPPPQEEVYLHHFELAHRRGVSTKIYVMTFRSAPIGDEGEREFTLLGGKFPAVVPVIRPKAPPVVTGPVPLEVLRAFLEDEGTKEKPGGYDVLRRRLETDVITSIKISRDSLGPELLYRLKVQTALRVKKSIAAVVYFDASVDLSKAGALQIRFSLND